MRREYQHRIRLYDLALLRKPSYLYLAAHHYAHVGASGQDSMRKWLIRRELVVLPLFGVLLLAYSGYLYGTRHSPPLYPSKSIVELNAAIDIAIFGVAVIFVGLVLIFLTISKNNFGSAMRDRHSADEEKKQKDETKMV
jgi:cytosine/uracil/thiamine/allantoin permease